MEKLEEYKKRKRVKISDDELYNAVITDRRNAERYFGEYIKEKIVTRYDLLHSNPEYYQKIFRRLSQQCSFTSSDIKDVVEWLMPSLTEVYFGADKIVGIFGRSPNDDPEILEKVISYQMQNQTDSYQKVDQWVRDGVEAGLGVIKLEWDYREETQKNWYLLNFEEFYALPQEMEGDILKIEPMPDNMYKVLIREKVVVKNQPTLTNVKPGEYIYIKDKDADGRKLYEAYRRWVPLDEIRRKAKEGIYRNVDSDFAIYDTVSDDSNSLKEIADAISNYSDKNDDIDEFDIGKLMGQEARKLVMLYDHWGWYDVDNDGLLELTHVVTCNGKVLQAEVHEYNRSPLFTISFYANSYQDWKEAVADYLQCIQDLKTALIRQVVINTSLNNNRQFAVDVNSTQAIEDIKEGRAAIRVSTLGNRGVGDFVQPMPKYEISPETFSLLELVDGWSEQKTGITKYNQGLDSDSLNKTATGIVKIMAASQQRLRKMARDGAENGLVPLYKHLIELNKNNLDEEFTFRLTDQYYQFQPDDIKGDYDVQITSNIGLQDKQLTTQNLMIMFTQIIPQLMQTGCANVKGVFRTAKQIIMEMGFNNPDKYLGMSEQEVEQMQSLPAILTQILQGVGLPPETIQAVIGNLQTALTMSPMAAQQEMDMAHQEIAQSQEQEIANQRPHTANLRDERAEALNEIGAYTR